MQWDAIEFSSASLVARQNLNGAAQSLSGTDGHGHSSSLDKAFGIDMKGIESSRNLSVMACSVN
jgi:hypothetical protein